MLKKRMRTSSVVAVISFVVYAISFMENSRTRPASLRSGKMLWSSRYHRYASKHYAVVACRREFALAHMTERTRIISLNFDV